MARKKAPKTDEEIAELLRDLLIVQLGLAKVAQNDIRKILGCSMGRVNDILKHLPKASRDVRIK
jgi:hypothetical protein